MRLYSNYVVDTLDNSEKDNPRPKSQIELRCQLFACYDFKENRLYVSNYDKKSVITSYISDQLGVNASLKNIYTTLDNFTSVYKNLKAATFTQIRNISTSMPNSIFKQQADLFGYDLPERTKLKVDYGLAPAKMVKNTLQQWKQQYEAGEYEDIILIGADDSGFESSFNFSSMISTIEFDLQKDENDRFDPNKVWQCFVERKAEG